jgi:hypothetical protein
MSYSHNSYNRRSYRPEGGERRYDSRPAPQARRLQKKRPKMQPPTAKSCYVLFDDQPTVYIKEATGRKFLSTATPAPGTLFPSRKKARAAIYWTVREMLVGFDYSEDVGETFRRFTLQYVGR